MHRQINRLLSGVVCLLLAAVVLTGGTTVAFASQRELPATIPQIRVNTKDGNGVKLNKADGYVDASVSIVDGEETLEDSVQFKVRGNTTAMTTVLKKSFTFKFAKKKNVLGMGSGKKWALVSGSFDPTLMRNYVAFDFAQEMDIPYTSNQRYVELWVDNSYRGCYLLYEPVQQGKDRVNIDIESNEGKKDFLIEYEANREEEGVTYFTVDGLRFIASEPETPDREQLDYITSTMTDIINTLKTGTKEEVAEKVDLSSLVKFYLLNEYVKTFDFDMSSVFFYYQDGKLYAGPPWDYDLSSGNVNDELNSLRYRTSNDPNLVGGNKNIYRYIYNKPWFLSMVAEEYYKHKDYIAAIYADNGFMDTVKNTYWRAFNDNYTKTDWKVSRWWINIQKKPLPTYDENYNYLKNWYSDRHKWLAKYLGAYYTEYIIGDADNNGVINIDDVTAIQKQLAGIGDTDENFFIRASLTENVLSINDATVLQRVQAGYENLWKVGETNVIFAH